MTSAPKDRSSRTLFGISTFLFWAALYLYVPLLPVYAQSLGANLWMVGVVIASYSIAQLALRVPIGVWADAKGNRKSLAVAGLAAVTIGALGLGVAPNPWLLFIARATTGIGAATWVAFAVLFTSYYPREQTGRAIAVVTFINGAALVTATGSGGAVALAWGTRVPFFGAALLGGLALAVLLPVKEPAGPPARPASWPVFIKVATDPLLLTVSLMSILVHFTTFSTIFGFIPVYAAQIGASSAELGFITMLALGSAALASLGSGLSAERWGHSANIRVGAVLMGGVLLAIPSIRRVPLLEVAQLVAGTGRGLLTTTLMALSIRSVRQEHRATAMGVYQALYSIGMLSGPLVSGLLADRVGIASVFYVSAFLCFIPAVMAYQARLRRA